MNRKYRKTDVAFHSDGCGRRAHPAVNVKVRSLWNLIDKIQSEFKCDADIAEKALNFAFNSAQEQFWEYWQDKTGDLENGLYGSPEYSYFPHHSVTVDCEGRSGGWLVVSGLPDFDSWDAVMLARWRKFEKDVRADVAYHVSWEAIKESIASNEWAQPYAEQYNHVSFSGGVTACVADLERIRAEAGERAVQRYLRRLKRTA